MLASLQRKTLIETKNRTLKCLKRHNSTAVRSMKNVAVLTENRAFALIHFSFPPRGIWQLKSPHPREFAIQGQKMLMPGGQPGGGGLGAAWIDVICQKRVPVFHQGFQTPRNRFRETDFCFEVSGTPDETRSTSFWQTSPTSVRI